MFHLNPMTSSLPAESVYDLVESMTVGPYYSMRMPSLSEASLAGNIKAVRIRIPHEPQKNILGAYLALKAMIENKSEEQAEIMLLLKQKLDQQLESAMSSPRLDEDKPSNDSASISEGSNTAPSNAPEGSNTQQVSSECQICITQEESDPCFTMTHGLRV